MVILILIIYILIGLCVAIGYSIYEYKKCKNNDSRDWDLYYKEQDLGERALFIMGFWPMLIILMIPLLLAQIPKIVIKKYYKIND